MPNANSISLHNHKLETRVFQMVLELPPEERATHFVRLRRDHFTLPSLTKLHDLILTYREAGRGVPSAKILTQDPHLPRGLRQVIHLSLGQETIDDFDSALSTLEHLRRLRILYGISLTIHSYLAQETSDDASFAKSLESIESALQQGMTQTTEITCSSSPELPYKESSMGKILDKALLEARSPKRGTKIGWPKFDDATGGIKPNDGKMLLLASDTGGGKSIAGMQIAINMAKAGQRVLYVSLEMGEEEMLLRMCSHVTGVAYKQLKDPKTPVSAINAIRHQFGIWMQTVNFELYAPKGHYTAKELVAQTVAKQAQVMIFDHVLLAKDESGRAEEWQKLSATTRYIKRQQLRYRFTTILLAQLNEDGKLARSKQMAQDVDYYLSWRGDETTRASGCAQVTINKGRDIPIDSGFWLKLDFAHMRMPQATDAEVAAVAAKVAEVKKKATDEAGWSVIRARGTFNKPNMQTTLFDRVEE